MAAKKRGLGRGLDALLGGAATRAAPPAGAEAAASTAPELTAVADTENLAATTAVDGSLRMLPVDMIERGKYQPRIDMHQESLQDLADSISEQGVVQPIVVRGIGEGRFEIIAGERRWRASQL